MITNTELFDLTKTIASDVFTGKNNPWLVLPCIHDFILQLGKTLPLSEYDHPTETVWIAKDATVYPSAFIGPCVIIDHGAQIKHCAFIRENAIVGKNATVGNSVELKNVILFDGVEVPHFNYVGDSILGYKAHMGAGSITSNYRADHGIVIIKGDDFTVSTESKKVGAMIGDFAEIGCNSVLNPGSVVGRRTNIYPLSSVRGVVGEGLIYKKSGEVVKKI